MWVKVNSVTFPESLVWLAGRIYIGRAIWPDKKPFKVMISSADVNGVLYSFETMKEAEKKLRVLERYLEAEKIEGL